ncbi:MAG: hypothetical protein ABFC98_05855 [Candidatus Cloacimonas sp.]
MSTWFDQVKPLSANTTEIAVIPWTPHTFFSTDSIVRPPVSNGYVYKCLTTEVTIFGLVNQGLSSWNGPTVWGSDSGIWDEFNTIEYYDVDGTQYETCRWCVYGIDPAESGVFSWTDPDYAIGTPTVDKCVNFKDSSINLGDTGNQQILGGINATSISFPLIQDIVLARTVAARELRKVSYPLAEGTCKFNRSVFKLEKGDNFVLKMTTMYGITQLPVLVTGITEEGPDSDVINITWMEDPNYLSVSTFADLTSIKQYAMRGNDTTAGKTALSKVKAFELPYGLSGNKIKTGLLVSRETGGESGFNVFFSSDGDSYRFMTRSSKYSVYGTVAVTYIPPSNTIDDSVGLYIDFYQPNDVAIIESLTRGQLGSLTNLAILNSEFISFQTITPVTGFTGRYLLSGIYGGRFDTDRVTHTVGEPFWFLGADRYQIISDDRLMKDAIRYFKVVPFTTETVGKLDCAAQVALNLMGGALMPYSIVNLKVNGQAINPRYTKYEDLVLTWNLRLKDAGAGLNVLENLESTATPPIYIHFGATIGSLGIINGKTAFIPDEGSPGLPQVNLLTNTYTIPNSLLQALGYTAKALEIVMFPLVDVNQTRFSGKATTLVTYLADWRP